jgi:hypothetical protein
MRKTICGIVILLGNGAVNTHSWKKRDMCFPWSPCRRIRRALQNNWEFERNTVAIPKGLGPEKDCAGKGQHHIQKTDPSSRQRGRPTKNKTVTVKQISGHGPQMGLDTKTFWLTDRQSQCDFDFGIDSTRVKAGSNTSTVTLRVVGGDEKGSLKSETVKYGREFQRTRTRERLRWQSQQHIQKTDPSSCQRGPPTKTRQ